MKEKNSSRLKIRTIRKLSDIPVEAGEPTPSGGDDGNGRFGEEADGGGGEEG